MSFRDQDPGEPSWKVPTPEPPKSWDELNFRVGRLEDTANHPHDMGEMARRAGVSLTDLNQALMRRRRIVR